jgi:hypothetical protein
MDEWRFWGERRQAGVSYLLGQREHDVAIYRWEPLTAPLRGPQVREFTQTLARRGRIISACQNLGLLRVVGPVRYENRLWVGWTEPGGQRPFTQKTDPEHLTTLTTNLIPLIHAYEIVHLAGLVVGAPDWARLTWSKTGFHLPDPWVKNYLARPVCELPEGITAIYPPEIAQGSPESLEGDCFYLGLILYCLIGEIIPYRLKNHWPQGVLAGKTIPLTYRRPHLSPALSRLIEELLNPRPEDRPAIHEVRRQWQKILDQSQSIATARDYSANLQNSHRYFTGLRLTGLLTRLRLPFGIIVLCWLAGTGYQWWWQGRPIPSAEQTVQALFKTPAAAASLINPGACRGLLARLTAEQTRRYELVRELTTRPHIKIKEIKVLTRSPRRTALLVTLEWWTWERGRWRQTISQEKMALAKTRRLWRIIQSEPLDN